LFIGSLAGIISTFGFSRVSSYLSGKGLFDVCGIHNLHAVPGFLGGIYSAIIFGIYNILPPSIEMNSNTGYSYSKQAGIQVAATVLSLVLAIFSGIFVGWILNYIQKI